MRIIFLNCWHGQIWSKLQKFVRENAEKTDIFCFLEVDPEFEIKLEKTLQGYTPLYGIGIKTDYLGGVIEGQSIFAKKEIEVKKVERTKTFHVTRKDAGGMQYAEFEINGKKLFIGSVHGKARPGNKLDTPARINQSKEILKVFEKRTGPKIIGGDFNLLPETRSVRLFEEAGYRNLIKEFDIKSTRNQVSWDQFASIPGYVKQYFADFCFVSSGIRVNNFEVPYNEVSDHLPLILDFDI